MCRPFATILLLTFVMIAVVEARLGAKDTGDLQQYIIRFDHNSNDLPQNREEIEQRAQQVASYFGGTVVHIYEHIFPGASIRNLPKSALILSSITPVADDTSRIFQSNDIDIPSFLFEEDDVIQLSATQQSAPPHLDRINQKSLPLDEVYDYAYDGSGVTVFVMDSGVKADHEEFSDISLTCGFNAIVEESCDDLNGHGTHVAGSVASRTFGVAKRASIISVKAFDQDGSSRHSILMAGLDYIMSQKLGDLSTPMVANMSFGYRNIRTRFLNDAANAVASAGVVMVAAACNGDKDACSWSPASATSVISVGAAEPFDSGLYFFLSKFLPLRYERRASFSNYGPCVDLFAWGVNVLGLGIGSTVEVVTMSGTSMAAPQVAGAAALYLSRDPSLTPVQVKQLLIDNASKDQMMELMQKRSPNRLLNTENIV